LSLHQQKTQACNGYVAKISKPTHCVAISSHPNNLSFFIPWSLRVAELDALIGVWAVAVLMRFPCDVTGYFTAARNLEQTNKLCQSKG
jgi:hypothetical protein